MEIKQVIEIIELLEKVHAEDKEVNQALKKLVLLLCDEDHITYNRKIYDILEVIKIIDYKLYDILNYYIEHKYIKK